MKFWKRGYRLFLFLLAVLLSLQLVAFQIVGPETFEVIREVAIVIVALFGGGASVTLVQWIKQKVGTEGNQTVALAVVLSFILAVSGLIAEGALTPETIRLDNFSTWFLLIAGAQQVYFRKLKDEGVFGN